VFGIQSRGGCSCAGPYGHRLLGIDLDRSHEFQREINRGCEGIKPGWVRVNFNYFIDEETFDYIVDAVIRFGHDSAAILEESYPLLNAVVEVLRDNEGDVVAMQVHGHSSADGDDAHNLELSEARAAAVVAYLEEQGVTQDLSSRGFGEEHLLCREETDACHARNRRVEFIVSHR
jgi:outer membrane protein OmpA-like peptidoglycan-associated protein